MSFSRNRLHTSLSASAALGNTGDGVNWRPCTGTTSGREDRLFSQQRPSLCRELRPPSFRTEATTSRTVQEGACDSRFG